MENNIQEHIELVQKIDTFLLQDVAKIIRGRIMVGNKILIFGNGGSAADAQHFAAELVGRFVKERYAMPAIALTTDSSIITAIANDYGFEKIFTRQLEALLMPGDVVIGISTSGNSSNVVHALEYAIDKEDTVVIALTGQSPNKAATLADHSFVVDSKTVARIQEVHELILHLLAEKIEE